MLMVLRSLLTLSTYGADGGEVRMMFNCKRIVQTEIKCLVAFCLLATAFPSDRED